LSYGRALFVTICSVPRRWPASKPSRSA